MRTCKTDNVLQKKAKWDKIAHSFHRKSFHLICILRAWLFVFKAHKHFLQDIYVPMPLPVFLFLLKISCKKHGRYSTKRKHRHLFTLLHHQLTSFCPVLSFQTPLTPQYLLSPPYSQSHQQFFLSTLRFFLLLDSGFYLLKYTIFSLSLGTIFYNPYSLTMYEVHSKFIEFAFIHSVNNSFSHVCWEPCHCETSHQVFWRQQETV